jgi:glutamate synthase domain-containing protein 2
MFWFVLGVLSTVILSAGIMLKFTRPFLTRLWRKTIRIIETDLYWENLWEIASLTRRVHPQKIVENSMRAETGNPVKRPFGSPKPMPHFQGILFLPCQMARLPTAEDTQIDTRTVIGPCAERPLKLDIPLMISGMAFGLALSERVKIALAKGATMAGTAVNAGEGAVLPEERRYAHKMIMQYSRAKWAKDPEILKQADMIEIHIGQGASGPAPNEVPTVHLKGRAMQLMGLSPGETAKIYSQMPGVHRSRDWRKLVDKLRALTGGAPIGMKMIPGRVEADLEVALHAGVDFVTLDGAQAGTKGTPTILQDDFGLPTVIGLCRAVDFLEKKQMKDQVSIIVSGGLSTPGDYLKALALGADAVALGSAIVFAASHTLGTQIPLPWEPPTQLVLYNGQFADQLDVEMAAKHVALFLKSSVEEMKLVAIALGKKRLLDVDKQDLVAMDPISAEIAEIPLM